MYIYIYIYIYIYVYINVYTHICIFSAILHYFIFKRDKWSKIEFHGRS